MAIYIKNICGPMVIRLLKKGKNPIAYSRPRCQVRGFSNTVQRLCRSSSNILTLHQRGLFKDIFPNSSDELAKLLTSSPQTVYCGFDPTAPSLHIGNLLAIITLIHCQRAGHNSIVLIGGATALIGDPSGKTKERDPISLQEVTENVQNIENNLQTIFKNHEKYIWKQSKQLQPIRILNNSEWYDGKNVVDFMSNFGRHLRMGTMLGRKSVKSRLESPQGLSLSEFSYQTFQAYDFLHLHKQYGCRIQFGGSDQMGNIMTGYELIDRLKGPSASVYGITLPLVTTTAGHKLGKTAGNAVWLNPQKTSEFELYQYFIQLPDKVVKKYLELFTFISLEEISSIMQRHHSRPEKRQAQKKLAEHVSRLVHGEEGLSKAQRLTDALYGSSGLEALEKLNENEAEELFQGAFISRVILEPGMSIMDVVEKVKCLPPGGIGERTIREGGLYINNNRVTNPNQVLLKGEHILKNNLTFIRVGKKNYYIVKWFT
ncbi:tyrosine--tRNA ligase, mitochondrial-like isoform X2 [Anneissia japonica]|uniref:tyrosine--tRNA ligase, mitochondrial-like isoform X2 n=1 Tax=Anneissia japonica TaxID=1529436 RepID=UPI00142559DC|nr:tyrosine--tRNA ligase, mitochondrial-like isoform X2 [Anneissia japonica]